MYRILYVTDDPDDAAETAAALGEVDERLDVLVETDASSVCERVGAADVDCVVSDHRPPGIDGLALLDRFRDAFPDRPFLLFPGEGGEAVASGAVGGGATDYLRRDGDGDRVAELARRCVAASESYRAEREAAKRDRLRSVARAVDRALVRAEGRADLEGRVCDRLTEPDPYRFAWVGAPDSDSDADASADPIVTRATSGENDPPVAVARDTGGADATGWALAARALETREVQVADDLQAGSGEGGRAAWRGVALDRGYRSALAAPVVRDGEPVAVVTVYAARPGAFGDAAGEVFGDLAEDVAHALRAREARRDRRRTAARLEALFDSSPDMVNVHDADGRIVDANPRLCEKLGYEEWDLVGKHVWDVDQTVTPEDLRSVLEEMRPGDRLETEGRYRRRDGSTFPAEVHVRRLDVDGADRFVVISRDVTQRKERERELERQEFLFERVQDIADIGVWEYHPQTDELMWSDGVRRIHGVDESYEPTLDDAIGFYHPEDRDAIRETVEHAIEEGEWHDRDLRIVRTDGETRDVRARGELVGDGADGAVVLRGVFQDVTERKERERALQRYEDLIENLPIGVYQNTPGPTGEFRLLNDGMVDLFDADSKADLRTRSVRDLYVDPEDRAAFSDRLVADGVVRSEEVRLRTLDGDVIWGSVTAVAREVDGETVFDGAIRDITERKEYERRLEAQRDDLTVLNEVVRHDIRNDLQLVLAYVELLGDHVDEEGREYLETARERAEQAVDLTRTAREMADVMLTTDDDRHPVGLRHVLERELDEARSAHADAVITVDGTVPDARVLANDMLDSVFRNLLKNAVQHNDRDVPEVVVSADRADEYVAVRVADNGPGIPDEKKEDVFGKGERGLDSQGTGLGLYLVRTLVERFGGEVRVEDNEPRGAVFTVELPTAE